MNWPKRTYRFVRKLLRYMANKAWYLCKVYYDPPFNGARKYLTWKDC